MFVFTVKSVVMWRGQNYSSVCPRYETVQFIQRRYKALAEAIVGIYLNFWRYALYQRARKVQLSPRFV